MRHRLLAAFVPAFIVVATGILVAPIVVTSTQQGTDAVGDDAAQKIDCSRVAVQVRLSASGVTVRNVGPAVAGTLTVIRDGRAVTEQNLDIPRGRTRSVAAEDADRAVFVADGCSGRIFRAG